MEKFLTVKEGSVILSIGKTNTYELFQKRNFPKIAIGKKPLAKERFGYYIINCRRCRYVGS